MDQIDLSAWAGRTERLRGGIDAGLAAMLCGTFDLDRVPAPGDVLPPLWHWCAFPKPVPMAGLKTDGHPRLGGFLPPVPMERRMWASGELEFLAPLHMGEPLTQRSVIASVVEKNGSSGPMTFVTVTHEIDGAAGLAIRERQDIVYLPIPPSYSPPQAQAAPEETDFDQPHPVSEALLFRYSACTFNAHRIHYDLPYAQQVEHYPGLVVHGPLQATLLLAEAVRRRGRAPHRFRFRGVHPLFVQDGLRLMGRNEGDATRLWAAAGAGHQTMQAEAIWEDQP